MNNDNPEIFVASDDDVARYAGGNEPEPAAEREPQDELARLRQELDEVRDQLLRARAECVNVTRRLNEEKLQAVQFANSQFARRLLTVVDDFERMLSSTADHDPDDPFIVGVRLVYDGLMKILREHHVEPIDALGKPFDPTQHEALMQSETDEAPPGHVTMELRKGYTIHGQVLRPTQVAVAQEPR
jgi:molecular chaperone GrpE